MNENQIDANIVIELLRKENADLRWQLTLLQAKSIQDSQDAKDGDE